MSCTCLCPQLPQAGGRGSSSRALTLTPRWSSTPQIPNLPLQQHGDASPWALALLQPELPPAALQKYRGRGPSSRQGRCGGSWAGKGQAGSGGRER